MNPLIEFLNGAAACVMPLAWPMFWQSCVLVAVVYAFEKLLRRRVGAAVRHALWLVVLTKLVLPPTLALPTGLAWWLPAPAATLPASSAQNFKVTYGSLQALPDTLPTHVISAVEPSPALTVSAWLLLSWAMVGAGLLAWMLVLWGRISASVHAAEFAPPWLDDRTRQQDHGP